MTTVRQDDTIFQRHPNCNQPFSFIFIDFSCLIHTTELALVIAVPMLPEMTQAEMLF